MSTRIVPVGAKGETWSVKVWNREFFFKKPDISFFKMAKKCSFTLKFRIRNMLFYSGHFVIENQGNYAKD